MSYEQKVGKAPSGTSLTPVRVWLFSCKIWMITAIFRSIELKYALHDSKWKGKDKILLTCNMVVERTPSFWQMNY